MNRIVFSLIISLIVISVNVYSQRIDSICSIRCADISKIKIKKYKFSGRKYQEKLKAVNDLIDTNAVFLIYYPPNPPFEEIGTYRFIRFFKGGIIFESCDYATEPNETQYNDLCYGFLYMYTFWNDEILIERETADYIQWCYFYGRISISRDTLIFYKLKEGRIFPKYEKVNSIYVRKKVPLYNFKWWEHSDPKDLRIPWKEREKRKMERRLKKKRKEQ
jgi:hypothetical protein